jgi:anti-sigma28 factor (negative regulator of flagellin synthesis)
VLITINVNSAAGLKSRAAEAVREGRAAMSIKEIVNPAGPLDPLKNNRGTSTLKKSGEDADEGKDRIEVSDEARAMYDAEHTHRFEAIREKIRKGFYFQREVTEKVVDAMLKDIKNTLSR